MLLRGAGEPAPRGRGDEDGLRGEQIAARPDRPAPGIPLDAAVVPGLLLLVARDLLLFDPPRVLAWRALHDPRLLAALPSWILPRPPADLDRDPFALVLAAGASGLALAYLLAVLARAGARARALLLCAAATVVVVLPTAGFMVMGEITGRPHGQDGGVVQLPLAMERILDGRSPYGADYSASMLGRQARVSGFWAEHGEGGNPILRHHAYLPGTHLLALPFYGAGRVLGFFDARLLTLFAWALMAWLATRLVDGPERRLCAAAVVLVNPLVYWHQVFGANDLVPGAILLGAVLAARRDRLAAAGALLGLACSVKQLAWPFAPFLLAWWSGARTLPGLVSPGALRRTARPALAGLAVFVAVVAPVALLDPGAFWADIVVYNAGLGGDSYPLGGTPGLGFANLIVYGGLVASLRDHVSFLPFYALLVPLGVLLLRVSLREGGPGIALAAGAVSLLLALYFSRVVHPNYLALAATLLPVAVLAGARRDADLAVVPLGLLGVAVEVVENEVLRLVWADAVAARLPAHLDGWMAALAPRAGPHLTPDPLGLALGALAAGLAIAYATAGALGAPRLARVAILATAAAAVVLPPVLVAGAARRASGTTRVQAGWATPPAGRALELFPQSFRRDPAGAPAADTWAPAPRLWSTLATARAVDPRILAALAAMLAGLLAWRAAGGLAGRGALASAAVAVAVPPSALGVLYGSGDPLLLATLLAAWWLARRGRFTAAGALAGAAGAAFPRAFAAIPGTVLLGGASYTRALGAAALVVVALVATALFVVPGHSLAPSVGAAPVGGIGLSNLALYRGAWSPAIAWALVAAAVVAGGLAWRTAPAGAEDRRALAIAAAGLLAVLWFLPGASAHDLLAPLALLALAAAPPGDE